MPQLSDIIKGGAILSGAVLVMWTIFIWPHSYSGICILGKLLRKRKLP